MMTPRTLIVAGAALAIAAISGPVAAQDRTGITEDTIKIGVAGPLTGPASEYSKAQIGAIAYYKWTNDQGGIHGRKIEPILEDTACDEAKGIAATRKLIFQDEVFALHANPCSGVALAIKPLVVETGIPYMIGSAVSAAIATPLQKNIFQPTPPSTEAGVQMAEFAMSRPDTRKIAIISHSNEWAKSYHEPLVKHLKDKHGLDPVLDLTMERQSTSATPQILRIKEADVDFVMVLLYPAESAIFLRDAHKYGLKLPFLGGYGTTIEDQLKRTGDMRYVENFYTLYLLKDMVDSPSMEKWRTMISTYYPNEVLTSVNFSALGGAVAMVHALKAAGPDLSRESLISELEKIRDLDSDVMAGPVTFTPEDHVGIKKLYVAGYVDGKPTVFTAWDQPRQ